MSLPDLFLLLADLGVLVVSVGFAAGPLRQLLVDRAPVVVPSGDADDPVTVPLRTAVLQVVIAAVLAAVALVALVLLLH